MKENCTCGNSQYFECSCAFVTKFPGNKKFCCEFCGIYEASRAQCNRCELDSDFIRCQSMTLKQFYFKLCGKYPEIYIMDEAGRVYDNLLMIDKTFEFQGVHSFMVSAEAEIMVDYSPNTSLSFVLNGERYIVQARIVPEFN